MEKAVARTKNQMEVVDDRSKSSVSVEFDCEANVPNTLHRQLLEGDLTPLNDWHSQLRSIKVRHVRTIRYYNSNLRETRFK